jgi:diguanylate cyclase (GGDEF)-like protein
MDGRQDHSDPNGPRGAGSAQLKSRLIACAVFGAGILFVSRDVPSPGLEWRLLAMAGLAFALSPYAAQVRSRGSGRSMPLAPWHSALFAGAITLGPLGAALPAAFHGCARIIFGPSGARPLSHVLYALAKPAIACSMASLAYILSGGNAVRPQAVDSFVPVLVAGAVYIGASMVLTVTAHEQAGEAVGEPRAAVLLAAWMLTLLGGYTLAVLYAVAPTYVLICLCAAAGVAGYALREPRTENRRGARVPVVNKADGDQPDETNVFVDALTGLANERYLEMFLTRELSRESRVGKSLSIAVFDIDGSKKLAEGVGKEALEETIIALGARLKNEVREYDLVARHSPHRLLVALPDTSSEEAYEVIIRLHSLVTSQPVNGRPVSASVGIATFPEHGVTFQELINASHRVLNHGRFMGPNCVHVSHRLEQTG